MALIRHWYPTQNYSTGGTNRLLVLHTTEGFTGGNGMYDCAVYFQGDVGVLTVSRGGMGVQRHVGLGLQEVEHAGDEHAERLLVADPAGPAGCLVGGEGASHPGGNGCRAGER